MRTPTISWIYWLVRSKRGMTSAEIQDTLNTITSGGATLKSLNRLVGKRTDLFSDDYVAEHERGEDPRRFRESTFWTARLVDSPPPWPSLGVWTQGMARLDWAHPWPGDRHEHRPSASAEVTD